MLATAGMDRTVNLWTLPRWKASADGTLVLSSSRVTDDLGGASDKSPSGGGGTGGKQRGTAAGSRAAPTTTLTAGTSASRPARTLSSSRGASTVRRPSIAGEGSASADKSPQQQQQQQNQGQGDGGVSDETTCHLFARIRGHSQGVHSLVYVEVRPRNALCSPACSMPRSHSAVCRASHFGGLRSRRPGV